MSTISEFRNSIRSGLVRQHKWRVIFDFPQFAASGEVSRQASLLARTTTTPASTLGAIELPFEGRILPVPGDRTFEEFTINFIGVNDMNVRNGFERWHEGINGSESNTGLTALEDYMRDIVLEMLDSNDNVTKTYVLKDAYPQMIAGMDMDKGAQDSYAEFQVTLRYVSYSSDTTR